MTKGLRLRLGLTLLMGAGLFVACSDDEDKPVSDVPVRFSSGLSGMVESRAANSSWDAGDEVGIYMVPAVDDALDAVDFSVYDAVNVPYVTTGAGSSVSLEVKSGSQAIYYPLDESRQVNFVAYYPYKPGTHTTNGNVYNVDVSDQSEKIDLIYHKSATAYNRNSNAVTLGFEHQLSKLKVHLVPASSAMEEVNLTDATLTLTGFPTTADFDLSTGTLGSTLGGTDKTLTPVKDEFSSLAYEAFFEAILVPHNGADYAARKLTFTIGGVPYEYTLPASYSFAAGDAESYTFKFTDSETGKKVVLVRNVLTDWGGGTLVWGKNQFRVSNTKFHLDASGANKEEGKPLQVTLSTTYTGTLTSESSLQNDEVTPNKPGWLTPTWDNDDPIAGDWKPYTLTFEAKRNISIYPRTGYVLIQTKGLSIAVKVEQDGIQPDGLANCYVVAPGGSANIPITRAITVGGLPESEIANARLEVLWEDEDPDDADNAGVISGYTQPTDADILSTFTVTASANEGNAVVALKGSNDSIYWSWHIWVTDDPTLKAWTNTNSPTYIFMDRNLGATEAKLSLAGRGLLYQWGRKDPFPGGKEGTAGYAALSEFKGIGTSARVTNTSADEAGIASGLLQSVRKPTTFFSSLWFTDADWLPKNENVLWNTTTGEKTVFDPCPVGWRVPVRLDGTESERNNDYSPWKGYTTIPQWTWDDDDGGVKLVNAESEEALYPAAGVRRDYSGIFDNGGRWVYNWTASVRGAYSCNLTASYEGWIEPSSASIIRTYAESVRCVKETP